MRVFRFIMMGCAILALLLATAVGFGWVASPMTPWEGLMALGLSCWAIADGFWWVPGAP